MDSEEKARMRKLEERALDRQRAIEKALEELQDHSGPPIHRIHAAKRALEPHSHDGGESEE